jgi:DNA-binding LacI/PurR family transcriptional regulator
VPVIKDVAKLCGLSISVVSKYLKNPDSVREDTRRRVQAAIDEIGYVPSLYARSMRTGKTGTVGVLVSEITNPVVAELYMGIYKQCLDHELVPVLHMTADALEPKHALPTFSPKNMDGLILCMFSENKLLNLVNETVCPHLPVISIGFSELSGAAGNILLNLAAGMSMVAEDLLQKGCRKIVYVGESSTDPASMQKFQGFMGGAMMRYGIQVYAGYRGTESGYEIADLLLEDGGNLPQAIVCETDLLALGCMKRLIQAGVKIPDQVSVVGFDDIPMAAIYEPSLSTVSLPISCICREIGTLLDRLKEDGKWKADTVTINTKYIPRSSTSDALATQRG